MFNFSGTTPFKSIFSFYKIFETNSPIRSTLCSVLALLAIAVSFYGWFLPNSFKDFNTNPLFEITTCIFLSFIVIFFKKKAEKSAKDYQETNNFATYQELIDATVSHIIHIGTLISFMLLVLFTNISLLKTTFLFFIILAPFYIFYRLLKVTFSNKIKSLLLEKNKDLYHEYMLWS